LITISYFAEFIINCILVFMANSSDSKEKQQIQSEVKETSNALDELASEIQNMANNGSLTLKITGENMSPVNGSFSSSKTSFSCEEGHIFEDNKCGT